jgi:ankyrin repeat protein
MSHRNIFRRTAFPALRFGAICRLLALVACGALLLGVSACSKRTENNTAVVKEELSPVAESPLARAAIEADLDEIKTLLDGGAELNAKDTLGRTALHMAAFYGQLKVTELLIERGADVNIKDRVGMTPLHVAVLSGGRQEVELLLEKKARINLKSDAGQTALHLAAATGQPKLSKYLIEHGGDPKSLDTDGKPPLFYAIQNKHPQTTALLKQYSDEK